MLPFHGRLHLEPRGSNEPSELAQKKRIIYNIFKILFVLTLKNKNLNTLTLDFFFFFFLTQLK